MRWAIIQRSDSREAVTSSNYWNYHLSTNNSNAMSSLVSVSEWVEDGMGTHAPWQWRSGSQDCQRVCWCFHRPHNCSFLYHNYIGHLKAHYVVDQTYWTSTYSTSIHEWSKACKHGNWIRLKRDRHPSLHNHPFPTRTKTVVYHPNWDFKYNRKPAAMTRNADGWVSLSTHAELAELAVLMDCSCILIEVLGQEYWKLPGQETRDY